MGLVAIQTIDSKIVYCNSKFKEICEFSSEAISEISALFPNPTNNRYRYFDPSLLTLEGYHQDILVKKATGGMFVANIGIKIEKSDNTFLTLLMIEDVTIQKKLQRDVLTKQDELKTSFESLLDQNKKLKELDLAKNRFLALTTHELRTPMSAILAAAEVLTLELHDSPEQQKEFITMINEQAMQLSKLINDVLDFAKIQAGKMDFFVQQDDVNTFLETVLASQVPVAEASGITLNYAKLDSPLLCYFDSVRLKQVIDNIVSNAIKYNTANGKVNIFVNDSEKFVKVFVKDTGKGISQESLQKVFDEFETLGKVANHQKGTGLGMPISRRLIEGMGGTINLESEIGVGTTFWIEIPKDKVLDAFQYRSRDEDFDLAAS
jgi:signal transduction histidine kinase